MASYSFLLTYSGFIFDLPKKLLGFKPVKNGRYFWSVDGAWGTVDCSENEYTFNVLYGKLELEGFVTALETVSAVYVNGKAVDFTFDGGKVTLKCLLEKNCILKIVKWKG